MKNLQSNGLIWLIELREEISNKDESDDQASLDIIVPDCSGGIVCGYDKLSTVELR